MSRSTHVIGNRQTGSDSDEVPPRPVSSSGSWRYFPGERYVHRGTQSAIQESFTVFAGRNLRGVLVVIGGSVSHVRGVVDCGPIDGCDPTILFVREGNNAVNQQFI